jgi:flagellar basal-body rod modification protein FlgD
MSVSIGNYVTSQSTQTSQLASTTSSSSGTSSTSSDISSGVSSLSTSYQTFLTLLTTQLKNQDPSSPEDPDQFTTELVQMTGVQQQLLSNQLLQQLVNASPSQGVTSDVGLIGQNVSASTSSATLTNGSATWDYTLPSSVANATVTVTDSTGAVVYSGSAPSFASGAHSFTWNGEANQGAASGSQEPNGGTYTLTMSATDTSGSAVSPTIGVSGTATSVQNTAGTTTVTVDGVQVPVSSINSVSAAAASSQ